MSTPETHQVNGTLFQFPELPPEDSEPVRKARAERDALIAKAQKVRTPRKRKAPQSRRGPKPGDGEFEPKPYEPGARMTWTDKTGAERVGTVWCRDFMHGHLWVIADEPRSGESAVKVSKSGTEVETATHGGQREEIVTGMVHRSAAYKGLRPPMHPYHFDRRYRNTDASEQYERELVEYRAEVERLKDETRARLYPNVSVG